MELRNYQLDLIESIRKSMRRGHRRVIMLSPTGSGKTVMFAHIIKRARERGATCWAITHRRELVDQTTQTLHQCGVDAVPVVAGVGHIDSMAVNVCSIQTLSRRLGSLTPPDIMIWDECHHLAAGTWSKVHAWSGNARHIGASATPERLDGRGLGDWFDDIVSGPSVQWLIDNGYLADYTIYSVESPDLSGVRKAMGDYQKSALADRMAKPKIVGCAVEHYLKQCNGSPAIAFCVNIGHSKAVSASFCENGIPSVHVDGDTPSAIRKQAICDLASGKVKVITNCELFGEGLDVRGVKAAILLRPTMSRSLYLQQVGRALRPSGDGSKAIVLDHAGNAREHGLPCDDVEYSLLSKKRSAGVRHVGARICPSCLAANKAGSRSCAYCSAIFPADEREVDVVAGELVKIEKERARVAARMQQGRATTLEALVALGKERGYRNPRFWAMRVINGRARS